MARLHSKKHGHSRSKFPKRWEVPEWQVMSKDEVEEVVIKLAKQRFPPSMIGMILRDRYGVPSIRAVFKKRLTKVLKEHGLYKLPEDLLSLLKKAVKMHQHLQNHKSDIHNQTKYKHVLSKIHRLVKYYKREGVLPADWKYSPELAVLLVK
ncbi:MAG: 30S ribosomal protein S15 [Candidatus Anstonellales archaeon]